MIDSDRPGDLCGAIQDAGRNTAAELAGLAGAGPEPGPEVVHNIRVAAKRLRSWWRLLRSDAGSKEDLVQAQARLRQVGAVLGGLRDAEVMRRTLEKLAGAVDPETYANVSEILSALHPVLSLSPATWSQLATSIAAEQHAWKSLTRDACDDAAVEAGLRRSYRRARRRGKRALESGCLEDFHSWRKAAKALTYQLELMEFVYRDTGVSVSDYRKLGNRLGQVHDLAVLAQQFARPEFEAIAADMEPLRLALRARRKKLMRACGKQLHQLFRAKASRFARAAFGVAR